MFYPVYEQKRKFLLGAESALNSPRAEHIAKQAKTKKQKRRGVCHPQVYRAERNDGNRDYVLWLALW